MDEYIGIIGIGVVIFGIIAEIFGRSKHIGRVWTFFLLIAGILPGVIALMVSPSANDSPTKPSKSYKVWAWICLIFGFVNVIMLISSEGKMGQLFFTFIIIAIYLFQLSEGQIVNKSPHFYFSGEFKPPSFKSSNKTQGSTTNYPKSDTNISVNSTDSLISALKNLKQQGLLEDNEYEEKLNKLNEIKLSNEIYDSDEYKQLKKLQNEGLLSEESFLKKVNKLKELFDFFGKVSFSNFNMKVLENAKKGIDIDINCILIENLEGKWAFDGGGFTLFKNNKFIIYHKGEIEKYGKWDYIPYNTILYLKVNGFMEDKKYKLKILKLNSSYMKYKSLNKVYYAYKESEFSLDPCID